MNLKAQMNFRAHLRTMELGWLADNTLTSENSRKRYESWVKGGHVEPKKCGIKNKDMGSG